MSFTLFFVTTLFHYWAKDQYYLSAFVFGFIIFTTNALPLITFQNHNKKIINTNFGILLVGLLLLLIDFQIKLGLLLSAIGFGGIKILISQYNQTRHFGEIHFNRQVALLVALFLHIVIAKFFPPLIIYLLPIILILWAIYLYNFKLKNAVQLSQDKFPSKLSFPIVPIGLLSLILIGYYALYYQRFFALVLETQQLLSDITIPQQLIIAIPSIIFLLITPLVAGIFNYLNKAHFAPSDITKILVGSVSMCLSIYLFAADQLSVQLLLFSLGFFALAMSLIPAAIDKNIKSLATEQIETINLIINTISGIVVILVNSLYLLMESFFNYLPLIYIFTMLLLLIIYRVNIKNTKGTYDG